MNGRLLPWNPAVAPWHKKNGAGCRHAVCDVLLRSLTANLIRRMGGWGEATLRGGPSHSKARPLLANCSQSPWRSVALNTLQPAQACLLPIAEGCQADFDKVTTYTSENIGTPCTRSSCVPAMILKLPAPLPSKVGLQGRIKTHLEYVQPANHGCLLPACRGLPSCSGSWVPPTKRGTACCWR